MTGDQLLECRQSGLLELERVNYFPRQLLTVDDMVTERDYFLTKLRRHNRFLHGWGVVCGLEVTAAPSGKLSWRVQIGSGYALGPFGDEIYVAEPVFLDLAKCGPGAATDPCEPAVIHTDRAPRGRGAGQTVFVAIKYAECLSRPVRAMSVGCGCEEGCEYSRIRDSFELTCLEQVSSEPRSHWTLCDFITGRPLPSCPPCPTEPWVVLARVNLPASPADRVRDSDIDNVAFRRQVYSTTLLQDQVIKCCCGEAPPPPVLLKVGNIRILRIDRNSETLLFDMVAQAPDLQRPIPVPARGNALEVDFVNATVNSSTVIDGQTFRVEVVRIQDGQSFVAHAASPVAVSGNRVLWIAPGEFESFYNRDKIEYRVTLVGDGTTAIRSQDGLRLDGEPTQLPSGNDTEEGNFAFVFFVPPIDPIL
jgi:hypothetical protein